MEKPCILVCPMDWGLGHAARCVPVIRAFIDAGCRVIAAASGPGAELLAREFGIALQDPEEAGAGSDRTATSDNAVNQASSTGAAASQSAKPLLIRFPGFPVTYSRKFLFLRLMAGMPLFLYHKAREKRELKKLVSMLRPDLIVSDNRYGLVHETVPSIIITHQLRPVLPGLLRPLEGLVAAVVRRWVASFDECWIPDHIESPAAGRLTEGRERLPAVFFTGWLSRVSPGMTNTAPPYRYRVMVLLSGPEPLRSDLENLIVSTLAGAPFDVLVVRGLPGGVDERERRGNLEIVSFMDPEGLRSAAGDSEMVVCRSGYSTVMDLLVLGKEALLVPTPGQTEQEYLGRWLAGLGWFRMVRQKDIRKELRAAIAAGNSHRAPAQLHAVELPGKGGELLRQRVEAVVQGLANRSRVVRN